MRPEYREEPCRSALNRVKGMMFGWSLNPYMGCAHQCTFCYVRAFEKRADRPSDDRYGASIRVKTNVADVLRRELARRSWKGDVVAIGAATDPSQPAEGFYRLTRGCLQVLAEAANPFSIITRGPMVVRDIDVLVEAAARAKVSVTFSVPTLDDRIWRLTEPNTPPPRQRLRALSRLRDAGIETGVGMAPILPGLSDAPELMADVVRAARDAGATSIWTNVLYLRPARASISSTTWPGTGRSSCRGTSGSIAAGRTSRRPRSSPSGARSRSSVIGSPSVTRTAFRDRPARPTRRQGGDAPAEPSQSRCERPRRAVRSNSHSRACQPPPSRLPRWPAEGGSAPPLSLRTARTARRRVDRREKHGSGGTELKGRARRPGAVTVRRVALRLQLMLVGVLVAAVGAAACSPSPAPSGSGTAATTQAAPRQELVLGCLSVEAAECQFIAEHVVGALPAERGPAFSMQIQLFGCPNAAPCPRTLGVRDGRAIVDFLDGGEPLQLSLAGPPQAPRIAIQQGFWSELVQPTSARVGGVGPFPFDLGHCGITHVVDFDGSFWMPAGQVDGDAPGIINAESGQMWLLGPSLVQYQGPAGFTVQLARFPGAKRFWLCD